MTRHRILTTLFPAGLMLASAAWAVPPQEDPMAREPENRQSATISDQALQADDAAASRANATGSSKTQPTDPTTATGTPALSMAAIKANFDAFDKNGDAYIDKNEAAADAHLLSQFDTLDADHDGKLSVTEFMSASNVAEFRPQRGLKRE